MSRIGGVVVLVVLVAFAGCAGLSGLGGDSSTPEPTPTGASPTPPTPTATPTPTPPTPTATPTPTPTPEPTPAWDEDEVALGVNNPTGVELRTYANNESVTMLKATVTVYDENGAQQDRFSYDGTWQHEIPDLEPGTNYTVVVSEIGWQDVPPVETTFDPGQTDTVEVFTLPDFQKTEQFEWKWRYIQGAFVNDTTYELEHVDDLVEYERQLIGNGTFDNGDWVYTWDDLWTTESSKHTTELGVSIDGELAHQDAAGTWGKSDELALNPNYQPSFAPIRDGVFNIDNISLQYVDTRTLNDSTVPEPLRVRSIPEQNKGERVHVFNILLWGYSERAGGPYYFDPESESRIYVDVETGNILRWESNERVSIGLGHYDYHVGMNPSIHVIDFYNHGDEDISVDPDDYPPYQ